MKLSIIIPVYNVEPFLERCIESVVCQIEDNWEIILVNDGSTDGSGIICDKYANQYSFITAIHKVNSGLSAARNEGLKYAKGEYILFLDSDDFLLNGSISRLINKFKLGDIDIIVGMAYTYYSQQQYYPKVNYNIEEGFYSGVEFLNLSLKRHKNMTFCAQFNIYCREFLKINNCLFLEGILHEDELWTPSVFLKAENVYFSNEYFYMHYVREGSITHHKNKSRNARDLIKVCTILEEIYNNLDSKKVKLLKNRMAVIYMHATNIGDLYKYNIIDRNFPLRYAIGINSSLKAILFFISPRIYCKINKISKRGVRL